MNPQLPSSSNYQRFWSGFLNRASFPQAPRVWRRKARTLWRLGACWLAEDYVLEWLRHSRSPDSVLAYAQIFRLLGRSKVAERLLIRTLAMHPAHSALVIELAKMHQANDDNNAALSLITKAARILPDDPELAITAGRILTATSHFRLALEQYERVQGPDQDRLDVLSARGRLLRLLGRVAEADQALTRALALSDPDAQTLVEAAKVKLILSEHREAEVLLDQALDKDQTNSEAWLDLVRVQLATGASRQAFETLARYERLAGRTQEYLYEASQLYLENQYYERALELLEELNSEVIGPLDQFWLKARCAIGLGRTEQAISFLDRALTLDLNPGLLALKLLLVNQDNRAAVVTLLHQVIARTDQLTNESQALKRKRLPKHCYEAILELLAAKVSANELDLAQQALDWAMALYSEKPELYYVQAQLAIRRGDATTASQAYRAGLTLDPLNHLQFLSFIRFLIDQQRYDEATEVVAWAQREGHTGIKIMLEQARLCREKGELAQAQLLLTHALSQNPSSCLAHLEQGRLLRQIGQFDAALQAFKRAAELLDDKTNLLDQAQILRESQQPLKALAILNSVRESQASSSRLELETALCWLDLGDFDAALTAYQTALTLEPSALLTAHRHQFDLLDRYRESCLDLQELEDLGTTPSVDIRPVTITVMLTHRCNLRCIMCGSFRKRAPDLPRAALHKLEPLFPHVRTLNWLGGEIFLVDYCYEYLQDLHRRFPRLNHTVTTNGLLLNDRWVALLASMNAELCFSIDSVVPATYESIRRPASFTTLTSRLRLVAEAYQRLGVQPNFSVFALLMRRTMKDLPLMPEFCKRYSMKRIHIAYLRPEMVPDEDVLNHGDQQTAQTALSCLRATEQRCAELGIVFECGFSKVLEQAAGLAEAEQPEVAWVKPAQPDQTLESFIHGVRAASALLAEQTPGGEPAGVEPEGMEPKSGGTAGVEPEGMEPESSGPASGEPAGMEPKSSNPEQDRLWRCVYPWTTLFIESDGWIKPHCDCSVPIGNLITQSLDEIRHSKLLQIYQHRIRHGQTAGWCNEHCVCLKVTS